MSIELCSRLTPMQATPSRVFAGEAAKTDDGRFRRAGDQGVGSRLRTLRTHPGPRLSPDEIRSWTFRQCSLHAWETLISMGLHGDSDTASMH